MWKVKGKCDPLSQKLVFSCWAIACTNPHFSLCRKSLKNHTSMPHDIVDNRELHLADVEGSKSAVDPVIICTEALV